MQDTIKVTGELTLESFDQAGNSVERRNIKNLILTAGKAFIANMLRAPVTTTATYNNSLTITVASGTGIVNGMMVTGAGIPANTFCTIAATTVTLYSIVTGLAVSTTGGAFTTQNVTFQTTPISFVELGNPASATTPLVGDLALNTPISPRKDFSVIGGTTSGNIITFTGTVPTTTGANTTISEAGLWTALTGGVLVARTVFPGFAKGASQTVVVTWNITIS